MVSDFFIGNFKAQRFDIEPLRRLQIIEVKFDADELRPNPLMPDAMFGLASSLVVALNQIALSRTGAEKRSETHMQRRFHKISIEFNNCKSDLNQVAQTILGSGNLEEFEVGGNMSVLPTKPLTCTLTDPMIGRRKSSNEPHVRTLHHSVSFPPGAL